MKKGILIGAGLGTVALATGILIKVLLDRNNASDKTDEERGVSPISDDTAEDTDTGSEDDESKDTTDSDDKTIEDEVPDLKADAINDGYKPAKY